jgi:ribokinase
VDAVVVGQVARDLVLTVDAVPEPHGTRPVHQRREMLGGKGANQAVGITQLGATAAVVGVVGDDGTADWLLRSAADDGVDVSGVVRRAGTRSALIVDVVTPDGQWRYLEDIPEPTLLTVADVERAAAAITGCRAVLIQLQQPPAAALAAARLARAAGRLVVLDGAPAGGHRREEIVAAADVVRADEREAQSLTGTPVGDVGSAVRAGRQLLGLGVRLVALGVAGVGNVFVWPDGQLCLPLTATRVVDTTGAGDALVAALSVALLRGRPPATAARYACAAAAATVGHPGGRPALRPEALAPHLTAADDGR